MTTHENTDNSDMQKWKKAKQEHNAEGKILTILKNMSEHQRMRILAFLWDKYVMHPVQESKP